MNGPGWLLRISFALSLGLLPAIGRGQQTIILSSSRGEWIEFIDSNTLRAKGRLYTGRMTTSVVASADGRTLFITKPRYSEPENCSALYALDLERMEETLLLWPAGAAVVSPAGDKVFTQRGNVGIDVLDSKTLTRLPTIEAPGVYGLCPSPDGRWIFGTNMLAEPSLDIFDTQSSRLVRRLKVPVQTSLSGHWVGSSFYLWGVDKEYQGHTWRVSPDDMQLNSGSAFQLPGASTGSSSNGWTVSWGDKHFFLYQPFGT